MPRVPAIDLSRSRDLGDIFSDTFSLYHRYFGLFTGIAFTVVIPLQVVALALGEPGFSGAAAFVLIVPWFVAVPLITAGHVQAVQTLGERRDVSVGDSLRAAIRRLPAVVGAVVLSTLVTLLGLVCLVLPGIFLAIRLYFSAQVAMAEGLGPGEALSRSSELTEGHFWRLVGIGLLLSVVAGVMGTIAGLPLRIAGLAADISVLTAIGATIDAGISLSFTALSGTILYFDLRARFAGAPEPKVQYPQFPPNDLALPERP